MSGERRSRMRLRWVIVQPSAAHVLRVAGGRAGRSAGSLRAPSAGRGGEGPGETQGHVVEGRAAHAGVVQRHARRGELGQDALAGERALPDRHLELAPAVADRRGALPVAGEDRGRALGVGGVLQDDGS
jgi:hypothetical protein